MLSSPSSSSVDSTVHHDDDNNIKQQNAASSHGTKISSKINGLLSSGTLDSAQYFNELNQELLLRMQERGIAMPSSTVLSGRFCIRVCITNHRTSIDDLINLCQCTVTLGKEIDRHFQVLLHRAQQQPQLQLQQVDIVR